MGKIRMTSFHNVLLKLIDTGFSHIFGSSVINRILSLLSGVFIIHFVPKAEYGIYANANNILGFFCISEGLGLNNALLQFGCNWTEKKKEQLWSFCFYGSALFNLILGAAILIVALNVEFSIAGTGKYLAAMALLPLVRSVSEMQRIYLRTEFRNREFANANTFSTVVIVSLSILMSYLFLVYGIISAHYIAGFITIIFICFKLKIRFPKPVFQLPHRDKINLLKFSAIATINNSSAILLMVIDTFLLGIIVAQSTVTASYKTATIIPTSLSFVTTSVMTYLYPYFAKHADNGSWCFRNFKKSIAYFSALNLTIVTIIWLFAPVMVIILFGHQYLDCLPALRILLINYFFNSTFATLCGQLLITQNKLLFNMINGFACLSLNLTMNLLLIPTYGSTGAALATLAVGIAGGSASFVYLYALLAKKRRLSDMTDNDMNKE